MRILPILDNIHALIFHHISPLFLVVLILCHINKYDGLENGLYYQLTLPLNLDYGDFRHLRLLHYIFSFYYLHSINKSLTIN